MKYNKTHTYIDKKALDMFNFNCSKRNIDYSPTFGLDLRVQNWVKLGRFGLQGKNFGLILAKLCNQVRSLSLFRWRTLTLLNI